MRPVLGRWLWTSFTLLFLLSSSRTASAQTVSDILGKLLGSISQLDAHYIAGTTVGGSGVTDSSGGLGLHGIGLEASLELGPVVSRHRCETARVQATLTQIQVHHRTADGRDSVEIYSATVQPCRDRPVVSLELGIGYSQISGFRGDSINLRGALEEKPVVSFYAVFDPESFASIYGGASMGLTNLKDFTAVSGTTTYTASASTFQYGLLGGVSFALGSKASIFVEADLTHREFDNVTWSGTPPAGLIRPYNLSTLTVAVGGQIQLGPPKSGP